MSQSSSLHQQRKAALDSLRRSSQTRFTVHSPRPIVGKGFHDEVDAQIADRRRVLRLEQKELQEEEKRVREQTDRKIRNAEYNAQRILRRKLKVLEKLKEIEVKERIKHVLPGAASPPGTPSSAFSPLREQAITYRMRERAHELARKRVKDRVEEEARKYEGTVRDPFLRRLDAFSSLSTTDYRQYSDKVIQDVFGSSVAARIQELSSAQAQTPDLVAQTIQEMVNRIREEEREKSVQRQSERQLFFARFLQEHVDQFKKKAPIEEGVLEQLAALTPIDVREDARVLAQSDDPPQERIVLARVRSAYSAPTSAVENIDPHDEIRRMEQELADLQDQSRAMASEKNQLDEELSSVSSEVVTLKGELKQEEEALKQRQQQREQKEKLEIEQEQEQQEKRKVDSTPSPKAGGGSSHSAAAAGAMAMSFPQSPQSSAEMEVSEASLAALEESVASLKKGEEVLKARLQELQTRARDLEEEVFRLQFHRSELEEESNRERLTFEDEYSRAFQVYDMLQDMESPQKGSVTSVQELSGLGEELDAILKERETLVVEAEEEVERLRLTVEYIPHVLGQTLPELKSFASRQKRDLAKIQDARLLEWKKSFVQMEGLYQRIQDQLDGRLAALCEFIIAKEGIKVTPSDTLEDAQERRGFAREGLQEVYSRAEEQALAHANQRLNLDRMEDYGEDWASSLRPLLEDLKGVVDERPAHLAEEVQSRSSSLIQVLLQLRNLEVEEQIYRMTDLEMDLTQGNATSLAQLEQLGQSSSP